MPKKAVVNAKAAAERYLRARQGRLDGVGLLMAARLTDRLRGLRIEQVNGEVVPGWLALSPEARLLLVLSYGQDMDVEAIALAGCVETNVVTRQIRRALLALSWAGRDDPTVRRLSGHVTRRQVLPIESGRAHIPLSLRRRIYERDGYACLLCGSTDRLSLDHITPYSRGGADSEENLRVLCLSCNCRKWAHMPE